MRRGKRDSASRSADTVKRKYDQTGRESGVHGPQWEILHGGYFSDPAVAAPFLESVQQAIALSGSEVIVDLGGGTGFMLRELLKHHSAAGLHLVNLDISQKQLDMTGKHRIVTVRKSINEFRREDAGQAEKRFLFIMRSALHYFGRDGMMPALRHLRAQMKRGEFFVHQTACFTRGREARCLNRLYDCMDSQKWYPTCTYLATCIIKAGWQIRSVVPAPPLRLTSQDLARRYTLGRQHLAEIRTLLRAHSENLADIFRNTPEGFEALLHYRIFTCIAA